MLPLMDMMNHPPANVAANTQFDVASRPGTLWLRATTDVPAGGELFYDYGRKSNEHFLFSYGFCLPNNPHNTLAVRLTAHRPWSPPPSPPPPPPPQPLSVYAMPAVPAPEATGSDRQRVDEPQEMRFVSFHFISLSNTHFFLTM